MTERAVSRRKPFIPAQAGPADAPRRRPHRLVVVFSGGLGSQLFQWAFAQTLRGHASRLAAETSRCRTLEIEPLVADWARLSAMVGIAGATVHRADIARRWPGYVVERRRRYDEDLVERARTGRYLVGGFRSLRYFAEEQERVRGLVGRFAEQGLTGDGRAVLRYLAQEEDIAAVHVRRAGTLPRSFYQQAFTRLNELGFRRRLWLSDDLSWVSKHLAAPDDLLLEPSLVSAPAGRVALMAACRGRILSDSTSAWWAGFLGRQPDEEGAVVAPARWFVQERLSPADLLAPGWQLR